MPNDAAASNEEVSNHMIVLLDQNIGYPTEYVHLKMAFSSIADPKNECPIKLIDSDYDKELRTVGPTCVHFEGVRFLLAAFTNAERCVEFMIENRHKRIFFITSEQMGRAVLPVIMLRCRDIFIDSTDQKPYRFIYIFCHNIQRNMDWMPDYASFIQSFTFDADLLVRIIHDIADYFVIDVKHLMSGNYPNYKAACDRLNSEHTLYERYRTMENVSLKREFDEINQLLKKATECSS